MGLAPTTLATDRGFLHPTRTRRAVEAGTPRARKKHTLVLTHTTTRFCASALLRFFATSRVRVSRLESAFTAKVSGSLDTKDGRVESRAYVRKKFFPDAFLSRVDMGLSYATTQDDVTYGICGKKSFDLTDDGLTTLDVKGGVSMGSKARAADVDARLELTQKIFNFQEDQDLKLRVGLDLGSRKLYGQIRENNWTFNTDFKEKWDVRYDL